ncbi:M57 family metalloprotease [uncultured Flavobacterium sp.]|uniref:M57 family metalloprotease n=1 Tax=uncultured Flavobacterium sp. TaxID=165435 RepID=UPI0030818B21
MKNKYYGKSLFFAFAISILFLFQNCSDENSNENNTESALTETPVVKKLIEMGYQKEMIKEYDKFYLVQGDLMFSKNINDYSKKGTLNRHASTNNLVSSTNVTSMTVYVDPSIPTGGVDDWRSAITNAISDLNNITGSTVHFELSTSAASDIIIKSDPSAFVGLNNVIAAAGFPVNNQPYNQVLINLDFNGNVTVLEASKRYNMVHELGHCIGLRHTNWDIRGEGVGPGANLIPNTPSQDPNSVMNGGTANSSWNGFSVYDLVAIRYLYPTPPVILPQITASGTDYIQAGTSIINWNYTGNLANADVDSIMWWYTKVNNNGEAPYVISWGATGMFMSVADTYYSDSGNRTSNFVIYFTIRDTSGALYRSGNYNIMQKGKYKLETAY